MVRATVVVAQIFVVPGYFGWDSVTINPGLNRRRAADQCRSILTVIGYHWAELPPLSRVWARSIARSVKTGRYGARSSINRKIYRISLLRHFSPSRVVVERR